ncbi:MAG: hypothetical protein HPM95_08125 [Alphaproteobacteria bacterium]|nr:hypothetical protein [Alphaproteobacteria bacterium]
MTVMMTNYEKYHPYSPIALWVTGILVFGATLGAGVATIGTVADAAPQLDRLASTEADTPTYKDCDGVIFRDADPSVSPCALPHPEQARVRPDRPCRIPEKPPDRDARHGFLATSGAVWRHGKHKAGTQRQ